VAGDFQSRGQRSRAGFRIDPTHQRIVIGSIRVAGALVGRAPRRRRPKEEIVEDGAACVRASARLRRVTADACHLSKRGLIGPEPGVEVASEDDRPERLQAFRNGARLSAARARCAEHPQPVGADERVEMDRRDLKRLAVSQSAQYREHRDAALAREGQLQRGRRKKRQGRQNRVAAILRRRARVEAIPHRGHVEERQPELAGEADDVDPRRVAEKPAGSGLRGTARGHGVAGAQRFLQQQDEMFNALPARPRSRAQVRDQRRQVAGADVDVPADDGDRTSRGHWR
jgi:hypothetical protein